MSLHENHQPSDQRPLSPTPSGGAGARRAGEGAQFTDPMPDHKLAEAGCWAHGPLPPNVRAGMNTLITGDLAFKRFHSREVNALVVGAHCTMDGVHFDLGEKGRMII